MTDSDRFQRIEQVAQRHITSGTFSGIEWLVLRGGKTWARGRAGLADGPNKVEMAEKPIYRIYSMTKPIVSAAVLMMMEQGKIRLFEPIATYLPEFAKMSIIDDEGKLTRARGPITIEHLLTHRSGLTYGFLPGCSAAKQYRQTNINDAWMSLGQLTKLVASLPLAFEPGTAWRYSVATDILAHLLEVVLERNLGDILKKQIFDPLAMVDTGFTVSPSNAPRIMAGFGKGNFNDLMDFDDQPQTLIPADLARQNPHDDPEFRRGGFGLFSTLDDYAAFARFLAHGKTANGQRLLSRKTIELMWTNRIPQHQLPLHIGPILLPGYGYSLAGRVMIDLGQALGLTTMGEHGWAGAASTYFWIDPKEDMIGITMAQYLGSKEPLGDDIRNAVYQALDE